MKHELKIWPAYFEAVWEGSKNFEIRKDDRPVKYEAGHLAVLREWDQRNVFGNQSGYTGREATVAITYVIRNAEQHGLVSGYCIFGFKLIKRTGIGGKENWL